MTAATEAAGQLLLVRHGETPWSRDGRHTGQTDVPLTGTGMAQARAVAPLLAGRRIALALSSPRSRALETAALAGITDLAVDADVAEWDYGQYEGLTSDAIHRTRPGWTIFTGDPPGGETAADVGARADRVLRRVRAALPGGDVVVFGHGHFSRVLTARYLRLPVSGGALFALDAGTLSILGREHASPVIRRWNIPGQ